MDEGTVAVMRCCTKCGIEKPATVEFFYASKSRRGGFAYNCKVCHLALGRERRAARAALRSPRPTPEQRFWVKVNKDGPVPARNPELGNCWIWTAGKTGAGYGGMTLNSDNKTKTISAHRFAWELEHGPIANGLFLCHKCDNPPCVRASHMFLGTPADNMADRDAKMRQAHGERTGGARLNESIVREIRDLYASGVTQAELSRRFRLGDDHVSQIVRRKIWKYVA